MKFRHAMLGMIFVLALSLSAASQERAPGSDADERLGTVSFPTSCSQAVQQSFDRAVALLHSFQYEEAGKGFASVAQNDPNCAMAHWGQAMSLYHQLWEHPDAETLKKGRAELRKAEELQPKTPREREYIAAAAAFFQDSDKLDYAARATEYSKAMEQLHLRHPEDGEAAAFYALSLVALPSDESDLTRRRKAIAILDKLLATKPDHPGVAHYLIHAADTPQLAPLGLAAARRYAKIAPSSAHALHMPSHIFTRLGLWQESIDSNLASEAAAEKMSALHLEGASYQLHAMDFLNYAYLQSGQVAKAEHLTDELKSVAGANPDRLAYLQATFEARDALELHLWKAAAALYIPSSDSQTREWPAGARIIAYWATAIGLAHTGDVNGGQKAVALLKQAHAESGAKNEHYGMNSGPEVDEQEAEAWLAFAEGKTGEAVTTLRAAAVREDKGGVDLLTISAREMLGDMLLELKKPEQALAEYEIALKEAPNRFDGLYGAARASELSGATAKAKSYYAKLEEICARAGSERPELREAGTFLAQGHGGAGSNGDQSKPSPR